MLISMPVITGYNQWYAMLTSSETANVRSRCCGRIVFYQSPGDEWCPEHRCSVRTRYGSRCSRRASVGDECAQHFSQHLRQISRNMG